MIKSFTTFMKRLKAVIKKPEMRILPGQLAFFLLLSIIPLFALIAVVASGFSLSIENLITTVKETLPEEIADFIVSIIDGNNINMNIIIFCISGFLLASNGPHSIIIGSNLLYKVKDKDRITLRVKAIFMTVILIILFLFIIIVPVFGDNIVSLLKYVLPDNLDKPIVTTYNILKYPISLFIIFFFLKLLYTIAPDKTIKSKTTTKGALFTTIGWIIATEIYSFYINVFARYNLLYGSVANLLILFIWIYILSYIFMIGMALNATYYEELEDTQE